MYKQILIGEYANYFIHNDGKVSTYDNNKMSTYALPETIVTGAAGHPWANLIGQSGQVYHVLGDNVQVKKVGITNAVSSTAFYTHHVIVDKQGGVKVYKDDLSIVELKTPDRITKAVGAAVLMVLDDEGRVWQYRWIATGKTVKTHAELAKLDADSIDLPGWATDIATSRSFFSAAIVDGKLCVWCDAFGAPFIGQKYATKPFIPTWKINQQDKPLKKVYASDNVLYILDGNDELWGMGNNWVGQVGNGEIDERVLAGDANMANRKFVSEPVNISRGIKWADVFVGTYYGFRTLAKSILGHIYACGYGKFGLQSHGIRPQDDPTNVGITALTRFHRVGIPPVLTLASTIDIKSGKVIYPPKEPRVLVKTVRIYDDGTEEIVI